MAPNNLPRLATFLDERLDRKVGATGDANCTICLERMRADSKDTHDNVVRLPCQHLFHFDCLIGMTRGYTGNRNKCPVCREALFELNLLSSAKEALRKKEEVTYYDSTAYLYTDLHTDPLHFTDQLFDEQLQLLAPKGEENYTGIPKAVRSIWTKSSPYRVTICEAHAIGDSSWLELTAAGRVRDRLEDAYMEDSWSGRIFMGAFRAMEVMYDEQFRCSDDDSETGGCPMVLEMKEEEEDVHSDREQPRGVMDGIFPGALLMDPEYREEPASTLGATNGQRAASETSQQAMDTTPVAGYVREEQQSVTSAVTRPRSPLHVQQGELYIPILRG